MNKSEVPEAIAKSLITGILHTKYLLSIFCRHHHPV